jgi:hypothetical protein
MLFGLMTYDIVVTYNIVCSKNPDAHSQNWQYKFMIPALSSWSGQGSVQQWLLSKSLGWPGIPGIVIGSTY